MNKQNYSDSEDFVTPIERSVVNLTIGGLYKSRKNGQDYQLLEIIDINQALFKNLTTLINEVASIHDFSNKNTRSYTSFQIDADEISDDDWKNAQRKLEAIRPFVMEVADYYGSLENRAEEYHVSVRTLQRWIAAYNETNSIASLLEKKRGWIKGQRRITPIQQQLIDEVINDFYLTVQKPTKTAVVNEVFRRCYKRNIPKPSKNAVWYQINAVDNKVRAKKRGERNTRFDARAGSYPKVDFPLQVIQIDHTPADIILVDDNHRMAMGRPYITVAIDIYSRMITGYYISLDAPSATSVGMCLARSILPKKDLLDRFDVKGKWDVFGIPKKIHVDNGADFRSETVSRSCALHSISVEFRPVAVPQYGGHIERLIGNLMERLHELPGTTFSNVHQKGDYESDKHACLTLDEFEKWFLTYVVNVYHQRLHSGINHIPAKKWHIGIFGDKDNIGSGLPTLPSDSKTLTLDFMPSIERTIQHTGVTIEGIRYYDPYLNNYINAMLDNKKRKFIFRQDPRDISVIWFFDPETRQYFSIPYANQSLPIMSLWVLRQIKEKLKKEVGEVNEALIYQAWDEMQELVKNSQAATKTVRRQAQRQKSHKNSQHYREQSSEFIELSNNVENTNQSEVKITINTLGSLYQMDHINNTHDDELDYFEDIE